MVIGYWLLVIGYWLLVIGYWLLVIGSKQERLINDFEVETDKLPMPNALFGQCPMPNYQLPITNYQFPMPNAQCPVWPIPNA
ncbi:MAG: hypothetical protein LH628_09045 [Microcoleus sp. CAN_BIN18]|nr:hypothetical protein [Microcoleus sp. CAN_BIN18]